MSPSRSVPASGCFLAGDHPQQRGLAGAVRADHADDPATGQVEAEVVDQHTVAVGLAELVRLHDDVAQPGAGGDVDLDLVELDVAVLGEQRLVGVEAGLRLVAPRAGVEPNPLELLVDRALAGALLLLLLLQPGALLLEPARVVALVGDAAPTVELEDPAGDVVEEVAIVGDGDDRAFVLLEVALEPGDRFRVEVVGRLVEQQQVGLAQEQPRERDAAPLAAGERGDVGVRRRGSQRVHRDLERRVEVPAVDRVDLLLHAGELVGGLVGVVHRQLVEAVEQRLGLGDAVLDVAAHVLALVERGLLLEQADGRARGELGVAAELGVDPGHDPQQRRLAGAVVADHADLRAGQERQRDVAQHLAVGRVAAGELVGGEDVLGRHVVV